MPVAGGDGETLPAVMFVVQRTRPLASDRARLEVLVRDSDGGEEVLFAIGVSLLATHTTVSRGMSLYHMPRNSLAGVELVREKKPKAKLPPSDTMVALGNSGLPETRRSSDTHGRCTNTRRRRVAAYLESDQDIEHFSFQNGEAIF
jgi:hypothetical protein